MGIHYPFNPSSICIIVKLNQNKYIFLISYYLLIYYFMYLFHSIANKQMVLMKKRDSHQRSEPNMKVQSTDPVVVKIAKAKCYQNKQDRCCRILCKTYVGISHNVSGIYYLLSPCKRCLSR